MVGFLVSNYGKPALGYFSQQVNNKHHLKMFVVSFLTAGRRQLASVLLSSTHTALGVGLTL